MNKNLIQITDVSPIELANLISKSVKTELQSLMHSKEPSSQIDEKVLLTRKETAELLKISLVTLHDWTNNKLLKHYKLGARTYYKKSEVLEALFNSNTTEG